MGGEVVYGYIYDFEKLIQKTMKTCSKVQDIYKTSRFVYEKGAIKF